MKLLLDLGNSRLKWAYWDGQSLLAAGAAPRGPGEDFACLSGLPQPQQVIVASVAGARTDEQLANRVQQDWHLNPVFLHTRDRAAGVCNGYEDPARLGVDRWLALVGAWAKVQGRVVVVDAGTAVTIDVLDAEGRHQGGLILPGIALMRRSLQLGTSGIDTGGDPLPGPETSLGRSTKQGIARGTVLAVVSSCARVVEELAAGGQVDCLLTGGDAPGLIPLLDVATGRTAWRHEPQLVFKGMVRQLQSDRKQTESMDSGE